MTKDILEKISNYTEEENFKHAFCSLLVYLLPYDKNRLLRNYKKIKFPNRNIYKTEMVRSQAGIFRVLNAQKDKHKTIAYEDFTKYQMLVIVDLDKMKELKDIRMAYTLTACNKSHRINVIVVTSSIDKHRAVLSKIKANCGGKTFII